MKKSIVTLSFMSLFILITAMQCDDDDMQTSCENRLEHLADLKLVITEMANTSVCGDDYECRYIALGSKPCGGPWEYLTYTTSIDTLQLVSLVENYNLTEAQFNVSCNAVSDCMAVIPPTGFNCENNRCIPVY